MKNNQITLEVNSKKLLDFIYSLELDIVNHQTLIVLIKEYATQVGKKALNKGFDTGIDKAKEHFRKYMNKTNK